MAAIAYSDDAPNPDSRRALIIPEYQPLCLGAAMWYEFCRAIRE